ncbi:8623_t:CDS:2 [Funneliformis mosseae]|uniref:8623_t:CDS:1 n=1 Tax=Funneliformis mosseae TaxID=27381 RepID=A0A9N9A6Z0_FUNMO|nr:8623_t:CDS:2 [Funneliformis mosseae]
MNIYAFVAAYLSNIMDIPIITYDDYLSQKNSNPNQFYQSFDYNSLHEAYLVKGVETSDGDVELVFGNSGENIGNIFIKKFSGGIPPNEQCLIYNLKSLEGHRTGSNTFNILDPEFLDPSYDYDFTNMQSGGRIYTRGNFKYYRPYGWKRIALKVLDKFDDNDWLGAKDRMNPFNSVGGINIEFGIGIYSTPYIEIASGYATRFDYEGETYKVVFQNRVKPNTFNIETLEGILLLVMTGILDLMVFAFKNVMLPFLLFVVLIKRKKALFTYSIIYIF